MLEKLTSFDNATALELSQLVEKTYGGKYYNQRYMGEGIQWREDFKKGAALFVIRDGSRICAVSCVHIFPNVSVTVLRNTVVNPEYQNEGFGTQLNNARMEFVRTLKPNLTLVENRAHVPGAYLPLLRYHGLSPIALTADDALENENGELIREYFYLSALADKPLRVSLDCSNDDILSFLQIWRSSIRVDERSYRRLNDAYAKRGVLNRVDQYKGGRTGIMSPESITPEILGADMTTVLFLTQLNENALCALVSAGYRFNGIRPYVNLSNLDERSDDSSDTIDALWTFSRIKEGESVSKPIQPSGFTNLSSEVMAKMCYLFSQTCSVSQSLS